MASTSGRRKLSRQVLFAQSKADQAVRPPPSAMTDAELLRFGSVAKYMCSQEQPVENVRRAAFARQLKEAQKEWRKRFPNLPLRATLDQAYF